MAGLESTLYAIIIKAFLEISIAFWINDNLFWYNGQSYFFSCICVWNPYWVILIRGYRHPTHTPQCPKIPAFSTTRVVFLHTSDLHNLVKPHKRCDQIVLVVFFFCFLIFLFFFLLSEVPTVFRVYQLDMFY